MAVKSSYRTEGIGSWIYDKLHQAGSGGAVPADLFKELRDTYIQNEILYKGGTYNSFIKNFHMFKLLGYVEPTGVTEPSTQRGGTLELIAPRTYYRITDLGESASSDNWSNPRAALYPETVEKYTAEYYREHREARRADLVAKGVVVRPRGRPRKVIIPKPLKPPKFPASKLLKKWKAAKRRDADSALRDLRTLPAGYKIADCVAALEVYKELKPEDYEHKVDYNRARKDVWNDFINELGKVVAKETGKPVKAPPKKVPPKVPPKVKAPPKKAPPKKAPPKVSPAAKKLAELEKEVREVVATLPRIPANPDLYDKMVAKLQSIRSQATTARKKAKGATFTSLDRMVVNLNTALRDMPTIMSPILTLPPGPRRDEATASGIRVVTEDLA